MSNTPLTLPLDENYPRASQLKLFLELPVRFNLTVKLDVTEAKARPAPFYAVMMHAILKTANDPECSFMRMTLDNDGKCCLWQEVGANYTIFNDKVKTFSSVYLPYNNKLSDFAEAYLKNRERFKDNAEYLPEPIPANTIAISMIPWIGFEGFEISMPNPKYLAPVITMGKYHEDQGRLMLPFSISLHHAAADGYHAAVFLKKLEQELKNS